MKEVIRGDTEPVHIVVANQAIETHKKYGTGNKYHPIIYSIRYRNKSYQIEVTNRKTTISASVITGVRTLLKVWNA
ncbi:DUF4060 family protein [Erwinia tracheiphila]